MSDVPAKARGSQIFFINMGTFCLYNYQLSVLRVRVSVMRVLVGLGFLIVAAFSVSPAAGAEFRLLRIDGLHLKWGEPEFGEAAEVSYGFATGPAAFADAINCGRMAPMAVLARAWDGDPALLERVAAQAFAMWSGAADISFRRAAPGERPDILIGAQAEPRRIAFANVWHDAAAAQDGVAPLVRATICFNPEIAWSTDGRRGGRQDLRTALAHEIGHAIGLDHPGAAGALMGFADQGPQTDLQRGDARGARLLYGRRARAGDGQPKIAARPLARVAPPVRRFRRSSP